MKHHRAWLKKYDGWKLPAVAAISFLLALNSLFSRPQERVRTPLAAPAASPFGASIAGNGIVEPKSEVISLGVELPGVVRTVHVNVGDAVMNGDPLFSLDERDIDAQIKTLEASLAAANVKAEEATAQFNIVATIEDKRAIAQDDVNKRHFAQEYANANVEQIEAQLDQARTTKDRLTVRAPIDGNILEVNVRPGEYANAGDLPAPLMRMGDTSELHLRVEIDEERASAVQSAASAKAYRRGDSTHAYTLRFVRFEPFVQPKRNLTVSEQRVDTRVLQVIYAIEKTEPPVLIGQQMDVFIDRAAATLERNEPQESNDSAQE